MRSAKKVFSAPRPSTPKRPSTQKKPLQGRRKSTIKLSWQKKEEEETTRVPLIQSAKVSDNETLSDKKNFPNKALSPREHLLEISSSLEFIVEKELIESVEIIGFVNPLSNKSVFFSPQESSSALNNDVQVMGWFLQKEIVCLLKRITPKWKHIEQGIIPGNVNLESNTLRLLEGHKKVFDEWKDCLFSSGALGFDSGGLREIVGLRPYRMEPSLSLAKYIFGFISPLCRRPVLLNPPTSSPAPIEVDIIQYDEGYPEIGFIVQKGFNKKVSSGKLLTKGFINTKDMSIRIAEDLSTNAEDPNTSLLPEKGIIGTVNPFSLKVTWKDISSKKSIESKLTLPKRLIYTHISSIGRGILYDPLQVTEVTRTLLSKNRSYIGWVTPEEMFKPVSFYPESERLYQYFAEQGFIIGDYDLCLGELFLDSQPQSDIVAIGYFHPTEPLTPKVIDLARLDSDLKAKMSLIGVQLVICRIDKLNSIQSIGDSFSGLTSHRKLMELLGLSDVSGSIWKEDQNFKIGFDFKQKIIDNGAPQVKAFDLGLVLPHQRTAIATDQQKEDRDDRGNTPIFGVSPSKHKEMTEEEHLAEWLGEDVEMINKQMAAKALNEFTFGQRLPINIVHEQVKYMLTGRLL